MILNLSLSWHPLNIVSIIVWIFFSLKYAMCTFLLNNFNLKFKWWISHLSHLSTVQLPDQLDEAEKHNSRHPIPPSPSRARPKFSTRGLFYYYAQVFSCTVMPHLAWLCEGMFPLELSCPSFSTPAWLNPSETCKWSLSIRSRPCSHRSVSEHRRSEARSSVGLDTNYVCLKI